ncbi:ethanolamine ammonia-lyase subunit EutC [Natronorubrum thiooxidans]|uniref:Putative ethanolamine ammonia-lyase small subunit n=1 Tax=Natronorubrum thiooxidans TaxID=308853 RepID=A0A1N7H2V3_9EURY|nr:ethanolamine ammonia-lyase subunit EutC [Natronorubrum thiooxidans]SIS19133.1 Ethanolamine ammonia-lyase light chain [Natronorubrum thiooxidans]
MSRNSDRLSGVDRPENEAQLERIRGSHPSRVGVGRTGSRPRTETLLEFRLDHAKARDAVTTHVSPKLVEELGLVGVQSRATSKTEYLADPGQGRDISDETADSVRQQCTMQPQVQIVVSDGLSSTAVEANVPDLLPVLLDGLADRGLDVGTPIFVEYGRVDVMDAIGEELDANCCVNLIGERPGLATNESLSAYFVYGPERGGATADKSVISNIHRDGIPPVEAGAEIAAVLEELCETKRNGFDTESR